MCKLRAQALRGLAPTKYVILECFCHHVIKPHLTLTWERGLADGQPQLPGTFDYLGPKSLRKASRPLEPSEGLQASPAEVPG